MPWRTSFWRKEHCELGSRRIWRFSACYPAVSCACYLSAGIQHDCHVIIHSCKSCFHLLEYSAVSCACYLSAVIQHDCHVLIHSIFLNCKSCFPVFLPEYSFFITLRSWRPSHIAIVPLFTKRQPISSSTDDHFYMNQSVLTRGCCRHLQNNLITSLPDGIFSSLASLEQL